LERSCLTTRSTTTVSNNNSSPRQDLPGEDEHLAVVVLGASGDLAKKKTFPSLFALYGLGLLPPNFSIVGFARSAMTEEEFRKQISQNFKGFPDKKDSFLARCTYFKGQYDSTEAFHKTHEVLVKLEAGKKGDRIFYMAVPPSVFVQVAKSIKAAAISKTGWTRIVVEKPFGRDLQSSTELSNE